MNNINDIVYAVKIDTGLSTTSESIGLYNGYVRFTTGGYIPPATAIYEDGTYVEENDKWFRDFITARGVSKLSSKIDVVDGGDYAYLQSATVKVTNTTRYNNRYHDVVANTQNLYFVGKTMTIYAVIDDVFYQRWTGVIEAFNFSQDDCSFVGRDKLNDKNDMIKPTFYGETSGKIGAIEFDDPYLSNMNVAKIEHNSQIPVLQSSSDQLHTGFINSDEWNGLSVAETIAISTDYGVDNHILQMICPKNNDVFDSVEVDHFIRYNGYDKMYIIRGINKIESPTWPTLYRYYFTVDEYSENIEDSKNLFDDDKQLIVDVDGALSHVMDVVDSGNTIDKLTVNFYTIKENESPLDYTGSIEVSDGNGNSTPVDYRLVNGNVVFDKSSVSIDIEPVSVKYFGHDDIYSVLPADDWTHNSYNEYGNLPKTSFANGSEVEGYKYQCFEVEFDKELVKGDYTLTIDLKNRFNNQFLNWQNESPFYRLFDGPTHDITDPSDITYGNAQAAAEDFNPFWQVEVYRIWNNPVYGPIPYKLGDFLLPNLRVGSEQVYPSGSTDIRVKLDAEWVTNKVGFKYSTGRDMLTMKRDWATSNPYNQERISMPHGEIDTSTGVPIDNSTFIGSNKLLIIVSGYDSTNGRILHQDTSGTQSFAELHNNKIRCIVKDFSLSTAVDTTPDNDIDVETNDVATGNYEAMLKDMSKNTGDYTRLINRDDWYTGYSVDKDIQRYTLITKLCKQGFVAGYTDRFGIDTYVSFLEYVNQPKVHDNDIIINDSIKQFKMTPISRVYNESTFKWNAGDSSISINSVDEHAFPQETDDEWKEYVTGVDSYAVAKEYWETAHDGWITSQTIQEAPSNRTNLEFAVDDPCTPVYLTEEPGLPDEAYQLTGIFAVGNEVSVVPGSWFDIDDEIVCINSAGEIVKGIATSTIHIRITYTEFTSIDVTNWDFETSKSYIVGNCVRLNTYTSEYIDLFLEWTTVQKYQVKYKLPLTSDTVKINLMDQVELHDPIVIPVGSVGNGWITNISVDPKTSIVEVEITFETTFARPKPVTGCNYIVEMATNTDEVIEDSGVTDYIIEDQCNY